METWLIILLSIVGGIILLLFIILLGFYAFIFYSPRKGQLNDFDLQSSKQYLGYEDHMKDLITSLMNRPFEDLYINSFDKTKLHARFYENKNNKKVAILFHGYRGTAYRDFCGGAKEAIELGYNVILVDHRAHGLSKGHSITFGVKEVKDAVCWVNYARNRFGQDIDLVLIGISMGGATVLMAADKVGPAKIIADCPYTSPKIMLKETVRAIKLPVFIFYPLLFLTGLLFAHVNLNKITSYETIKNTNNKILIIHGDHDSIVPYKISNDLYKTYQDKIQYELFPGAEHGMSYLEDTARYQKIIREFLN